MKDGVAKMEDGVAKLENSPMQIGREMPGERKKESLATQENGA